MRSAFPFSISLTGLSTSVTQTTDFFLMVPPDVALERAFVRFSADVTSSGVLQVSVVQDLGDGEFVEIVQNTVITQASQSPTELEVQSGSLDPHKALYVRIISSPEGGATPWWATATLMSGTMHMRQGQNPNRWDDPQESLQPSAINPKGGA